MITLHHLNKSRSKRIIWLLEELNVPYDIVAYQRVTETNLAPDSLKAVHPLGKSPVIEIQGQTITESGAIIEYLTAKHGASSLMPSTDSAKYAEYLQWLHFAESSAALPLLLHYFLKLDTAQTNFLGDYATAEVNAILSYLNNHLTDNTWLLGENFSAADIMMSFIVEMSMALGLLGNYPAVAKYTAALQERSGAQKANALEAHHDKTVS